MPGSRYVIRPMKRTELDIAVSWAADEGWNPGLRDAGCFWAADPQGYYCGELDGEIIATISAVNYGGFGFIGFYIVRPDMRGKGYGLALWEHALETLSGVNVGLDGVLAQEANYQKFGFVTAYSNIRFCWDSPPDPCVAEKLVPLEDVPVEDVLEYDRHCFPAPREAFLRCWLEMPNAKGLAVAQGGEILGYGLVRTCAEGCKIGPLFAEDCDTADTLLMGLGAAAEQTPVYIDIPQPNIRGLQMADRYGMREVFRTVRMYTGGEPAVDVFKMFGVTSFELG